MKAPAMVPATVPTFHAGKIPQADLQTSNTLLRLPQWNESIGISHHFCNVGRGNNETWVWWDHWRRSNLLGCAGHENLSGPLAF